MKITRAIDLLAPVGFLLLLAAGCVNLGKGTTSPTRLFHLAPLAASEVTAHHSSLKAGPLGVGPLSFPEYLNRPQIVTRIGENEIRTADFANWAEPLQRNFLRVLAENLVLLLGSDAVYTHPWRSNLRPAYRLEVKVIRFDADPTGDAVLTVDWEILDRRSNPVSPQKKSIFREAVNGRDDPAVVKAMSNALGAFSRAAAAQIAAFK